jgi:spermidine/putrescine-binding protein
MTNARIQDFQKMRPTRRQLMALLGTAGLGLATMPLINGRAVAAPKLTFFTWSGYELPDFHKAYVDKYGESPTVTFFGGEEEALQKIRSGYQADICHPCTYTLDLFRDSGVLKPIDTGRIPRWNDLFPSLQGMPILTKDGQLWQVPFDWGSSSFIYRPDLVDVKPEDATWSMLFDEKYAGKIAPRGSTDGGVVPAGIHTGAADPWAMTDDELAKAGEALRKQREMSRFYWDDATSMYQAFAAGEVVIAYAWSSALAELSKQGVPVVYANPKEGRLTWVCGLVMLKDGDGDEQAAYDLIDAMLAPESGKYLIEQYGTGHANRKSFDIADPAAVEANALGDPDKALGMGKFIPAIAPEIRAKYTKLFDEVKAGF